MREWELEALARARARCPVTNHCFVGIKPVWTDDPYDEFGQCVFEATCLVDVIGPTCGPLARRICRHHRLEALEGDPFTHRPCGAYLIFVWFS